MDVEMQMANKVWVVETLHHDPGFGWVVQFASPTRANAWDAMREYRKFHPAEKYRTVGYVPSGGSENG
jgi:hypothetical protein